MRFYAAPSVSVSSTTGAVCAAVRVTLSAVRMGHPPHPPVEDGPPAPSVPNGDAVAYIEDDRLRLLRGGDDVVVLVTGQVQVVEGIAVHHGGADILQHTDDFVLARQGQIGVIGG